MHVTAIEYQTKGEKPIEKNVIVTDEFGKEIGRTYPKRARGLVKNGRAEYASDCEIRLLQRHTHAPENTEDFIMSNVINFNAREFKFDSTCDSNVGSRMVVNDKNGKVVEMYEIGDWNWSWTQIKCTKQLEPNTDYIFRFAMTGGHNDTNDAVSQFIIFEDNNWDDRFTYPLDKSRFKPLFSKRDESGLLRVYEIPFTTGETGNVTFLIVAQHAVAKFMPALENDAYAELEDLTYEQWWAERNKSFEADENSNNFGSWRNIDLSGAVISSGRMLKKILEKVPFGANIDLSGAVIDDNGDDDEFDADDFSKTPHGRMNEAIERIRAQYEAAPEGSAEKFALKEALETLQRY